MVGRQRFFVRIGIVSAAPILAGYWWIAVASIGAGRMFAYGNYWGAPIGAITLVIALVVLTPAWLWATVRYWNWHGHRASGD